MCKSVYAANRQKCSSSILSQQVKFPLQCAINTQVEAAIGGIKAIGAGEDEHQSNHRRINALPCHTA